MYKKLLQEFTYFECVNTVLRVSDIIEFFVMNLNFLETNSDGILRGNCDYYLKI